MTWEQPLHVLQGIDITRYNINGNVTCYDSDIDYDYVIETNVSDHTYAILPSLMSGKCRNYNITVCVNAVTAAGPGDKACKEETILSNSEMITNDIH